MQQLVPALADLIGLALAYLLLPPLAAQFQNLSFINTVIVGAGFVLFCLAVYSIKKLQPATRQGAHPLFAWFHGRRTLTVLGVVFSLFLTVALGYVAGFLDSVVAINRQLLDEPSVTIYLLLTPASWFGLSLIYMLLLASETERTVLPGSGRYALFSLFGLSGTNLMAVVGAAVWQAVWVRFEPAGNEVTIAVLIFLLSLLLFGPPRLLYMAKQRSWLGLATFVPLLAYLAWVAANGNL